MSDTPKTPKSDPEVEDAEVLPVKDDDASATTKPDGDAVEAKDASEAEAQSGPADASRADATADGVDGAESNAAEPDAAGADEKAAKDPASQLDAALAASPLISSGSETPVEHDAATNAGEAQDADAVEEQSGSLAGRVLTWLILLIVGGGLALWGAPQVAPYLPSGLAPVAAWLTPGQSRAVEEVAALRAEVASQLAALPDPDAVTSAAVAAAEAEVATLRAALAEAEAGATAGLAAAEADLSEAADTLETRVAAVAADVGSVSDRLAALENADFSARLAQIETSLAGLLSQMDQLTAFEPVEGLPEGTLEDLTAFQASVAGLRAEISALAAVDGTLEQRLEGVIATTERQIEDVSAAFSADLAAARSTAEEEVAAAEADAEAAEAAAEAAAAAQAEAERLSTVRAASTLIDAAIASGEPYRAALDTLTGASNVAVPEILVANADGGVATQSDLQARFADAAHAAIRADIQDTGDGSVIDRLGAFVGSQVATRSLTPQEGDSVDAVLSRAEDALRTGDLGAAVAEASALDGPAAEALTGWMTAAEARLGAADALATFRDAALATN